MPILSSLNIWYIFLMILVCLEIHRDRKLDYVLFDVAPCLIRFSNIGYISKIKIS